MDTLEEYIKMCDCEEIQEQGVTPPHQNDYYARRKYGAIRYGYQIITSDVVDDDYIWLPRQDQIQEMLGVGSLQQMECVLMDFAEECNKEYMYSFDSLEKLWLAFYLYEKHGKVWNGEKWMKNEEKSASANSR